MTSNSDIAVVNARWLSDVSVQTSIDGTVKQRAIIYTGESKEFKEFEDKSTYIKGNIPLTQIENQNKGIKLINVQQYLNNTIEELKIL